jgi:uncharacterized membrane protein required for colicin V production
MSFVDLIGILLTVSLCYVGYLKGLKNQLFFIISFVLSSFILYLSFKPIFDFVNVILKSPAISGFIATTFIALPLFLLIEWCFKKLFSSSKTSFSSNRNKISFISRIISSIISFIFGYICIFIAIENLKQYPLEHSFFYDVILEKTKDEEVLKILNVLKSNQNQLQLALSKDDANEIANALKSLSFKKLKNLSDFLKENKKIDELIFKISDFYLEDTGKINPYIERLKNIIELKLVEAQTSQNLEAQTPENDVLKN